jgi:nucleoside-diphosphate-sugar epimerase
MRDILITGIDGYIGSRIAEQLLKRGKTIFGVDVRSSNIGRLATFTHFNFFNADITNLSSLPKDIVPPEILIHCAALVHNKSKDLSCKNYFHTNVQGTRNVLAALDRSRLKQIIFLSTVSVYGQKMQDDTIPDESSPPAPEDFYGESKWAAEIAIQEFSRSNKIPFTIFRLTPVYGKSFLLNINKRIYLPKKIAFYKFSTGDQLISLCSIHNVMDVVADALDNSTYFNETYIVKDRDDYSLNQIIDNVQKIFSQKRKPIIRVPLILPRILISCLGLVNPKKGQFYNFQLRKIVNGSVFSGEKIRSSGIPLRWNVTNTLSENKQG